MSEFIAEAQVLITPNVSAFAATLKAEVEAAVRTAGAITIPVTPVVANAGGLAAQTAATNELAASTERAAASTGKKTAADRAAEASSKSLAASFRAVELAEREVLTTENAVSIARTRLGGANTALTKAENALSSAIASGQGPLIQQAEIHAALAAQYQTESAAAFELAKANASLASSQTGTAATTLETAAAADVAAASETRLAKARQLSAAELAAEEAALASSAASQRTVANANRQLELAARASAAGQRRAVTAASELAAARGILEAEDRALIRAEEALRIIQGQSSTLLTGLVEEELALAAARRADALAAFELAEANAGLASQEARETAAARASTAAQERRTAGLTKGAASTGLAAIGARGATLAASGPFLAGAAATVGLIASLKAASDLDVQLNVLRVTAEATGAEMEAVSAQARELGTDINLPGVSAIDAATAMTELSKAGLDVQNSIEGARGVLQLATAAGIDNAAATQLAASALNAFGLAGDQATHVADVFANAANESQGSIVDIGTAFQQAAAVARLAGVSFEDTAALLTLLARNGLQGSDAGTSLRTAFIRLINPTKEAAELLDRLNISVRDINGNVRPEVFAEFAEATQNLGRQQQDAATAIVFGQDAIRAAAIAGREGITAMNETREALDRQGAAAEQAAARNTGLRGALENLKNQAVDLGISIGEGASGPTEEFVNILAGGVKNINDAAKALDELQNGTDEGGTAAERAAKQYQELATQLGVISASLDLRRGEGFAETSKTVTTLREEQERLKKALAEVTSSGVTARSSVEDYAAANRETANAAEGLNNRLDESVDRFTSVARAIKNLSTVSPVQAALGQIAGFEEQANRARAAGDVGGELSSLRSQAQRQQAIIDEEGARAQGDALKRRRAAQAALASINSQITAIEQGIASEQEQAANEQARIREDAAREQVRIRTEADRKVIAAIEAGRRPLDLRQITADDTETLKDNIALARDRKQFLQETINVVRTSIKDDKLRADTIASLVEERKRISTEIGNLLEEQANAAKIAAQDAADQRTENLAKITRIAELRGNDAAILRGLNAQIANARKRIAAARKAKEGVLDEQVALEELLAARRDLINKTKEGKEEAASDDFTSAFELLQGAADTFRSNAGNLIGGNQPFAGPTGFTADLAQFLRRQQPQAIKVDTTDVVGRAVERQISSLDRLSDVIERDIESRTGNTGTGAGAPGSTYANITAARAAAMGRFWQSTQARRVTDGRMT